ncbi:hypothetical protein BV25DRAFT_1163921 [Artomyces pyxidatus]|uniref:Uncharacterized protein n=1 Tax=Artomyces pyxidatus TaxID=48021 RepID=A0ACB8ST40_9AGAM|nr:hypothetical protein BV25DRAFT_1163921 [Artomyces pyxidatus]
MRDGPARHGSTAERLSRLRKYEDAWRKVVWAEEMTIPGHGWYLYGDVLAKLEAETLSFYQLPSKLRGIEARQWEVQCGLIRPCFYMDSAQDLLVLVGRCGERFDLPRCIRFRSLLTGGQHTAGYARDVELPAEVQDDIFGIDEFSFQVYGDHFAVAFENSVTEDDRDKLLLVYNWKTATVVKFKPEMFCGGSLPEFFTFLDHFHLIFNEHRGSLVIYELRPPGGLSQRRLGSTNLCRFLLPNVELENSGSKESGNAGSLSYRGTFATVNRHSVSSSRTGIFSPVHNSDIIVLENLHPRRLSRNDVPDTFAVRLDTFRSHLHRLQERKVQPKDHVLEWNKWGPEALIWGLRVRSFGHRLNFPLTHGTKGILELTEDNIPKYFLCDFRPFRCRRATPSDSQAHRPS